MAKIPQPRSWNQIIGDMLNAFLSRYGLKSVKRRSVMLSAIEMAAQSDLRSSQDTFDLLNSNSLDRASGVALDRIGNDEGLKRETEAPATGTITVTDTSFSKITSKIYQGLPAPIVGSVKLYVVDASNFPATGQVYVGRGTPNYEGPLSYTAKTNNGTYWTLTLSTSTRKFHNLSEGVVVAQGGNRVIPAGSLVQTPQGNLTDAVQFSVLFAATIPDGETEVTGVQVLAQKPGLASNVIAGQITSFVTSPFPGAIATNPLPFTNGKATEDDKTFRDRIRAKRQSRVKGTALAITTELYGLVASDENKRIASSSVVAREGVPTTVYIDDGTGYEESSSGVAIESILASATGGEKWFQLKSKPLSKAAIITTMTAPFKLKDASRLAISVGGVTTEHVFSASDFKNVANATAYEVAASINANPNVKWGAATSAGGTKVRIFAKDDTNEDLQVVAASDGAADANEVLLLPTGLTQTLWLAKNDVLLSKDGQAAVLRSNPVASWAALSSGETLAIAIDGTAAQTYTFVDQDFVDAGTGFATVGANTLDAWAAVLNAKIPGMTTTVADGLLVLTSNAGRSSRASISLTGGSLVTKQVLSAETAKGKDLDYTLNRNTGQIRLVKPLAAGDTLGAGTTNSRPFIQSSALGVVSLSGTASLYFVVDGAASIIQLGTAAGAQVQVSTYANESWGKRVVYTALSGTPFADARVGDWLIIQGDFTEKGAWRIAYADSTHLEIERSGFTAETVTLTASDSLVVVRTPAQLQKTDIAAGSYTASSLVSALNTQLVGATAEVYKTSRVRVRTNTFDGGDIALVAANASGKQLGMALSASSDPGSPHVAAARALNSTTGTPSFIQHEINAVSSASAFTVTNAISDLNEGSQLVFVRNFPEVGGRTRWGSNAGFVTGIDHISSGTINTRLAANEEFLPQDRFYAASPYAIGPNDDLVVVVDQDEISHRYSVPMFRKLTPSGSVYGLTNAFKDADNGGASLATAFGLSFDFTDFAIHMAARAVTDSSDSTKSILWRYKRLGPDGEQAAVRYVYPTSASQALAVTTDNTTDASTYINVSLPSGALKAQPGLRSTTKVGTSALASGGAAPQLIYVVGLSISSASRVTKLDYNRTNTAQATSGTVTGGTSGAVGTIVSDSLAAGSSGASTLVISGVTGTFQAGETLTFSQASPPTGTASGPQYQQATLTLTLPPSITDHGVATGSSLYVQSSSTSFPSGLKTVTKVDATHVLYTEAGTDGTVANIGTVSFDTAEATISAAVGDILTVASSSGLPSEMEQTIQLTSVGAQYVEGTNWNASGGSNSSVLTWTAIGDASAFKVYPLTNNTASAIVAAVNAQASSPVTAKVLGTGAGSITQSSNEQAATNAATYTALVDGQNWIASVTYPATVNDDYQFAFKKPVSVGLTGSSDWANEDVRVVPNTALAITRWLNSPAVTGLASACSIATSFDHSKVQLSTLTDGSAGAIQVQGGSANSGSAAISGSAIVANTAVSVTVPKADADRFTAGMWLRAQNQISMPKALFSSTSAIQSIDATGVFTMTSSQAVYSQRASSTATLRVEKQGAFVAYSYSTTTYGAGPTFAGVTEGDWVRVDCSNSLNAGLFRVVRADTSSEAYTFWVENPNAIEGDFSMTFAFYTPDSLMPGDTINIGTDVWGAGNKGLWTVQFVGGTNSGSQFSNQYVFKVDVSKKATQAFTGPIALGSASSLVQVLEGKPATLIKKVLSITPNQGDLSFLDLKLSTSARSNLLSEAAGTVLTPMDRLGFSEDVVIGADGYRKSIGLIGEANRVLYGDRRDPATYPGVVAAGARVNIEASLIKRIQVALNLRINGGNPNDIKARVQSAVAAVINKTPVGQSIAISDIVTAAKVNGVVAVSVLSPTYSSASDMIPVQPGEKPRVLDLASDVTVTFA